MINSGIYNDQELKKREGIIYLKADFIYKVRNYKDH